MAEPEKPSASVIGALEAALDVEELAVATDTFIRDELQAQGVDSARLEQRLAALLARKGRQAAKVRLFPPWVKENWEVQLAAASGSAGGWMSMASPSLPGPLRLQLLPRRSGVGSGTMVVSWEADFHHPPGYVLELFRQGDDQHEPSFTFNLGARSRGSVALTTAEIGFDPTLTAFQCHIRSA